MARDETTAQAQRQNKDQTQVSAAEIAKVIEDIVQQKDPFDERVICYAQPIYDTHTFIPTGGSVDAAFGGGCCRQTRAVYSACGRKQEHL